jgi:hypothetical protein
MRGSGDEEDKVDAMPSSLSLYRRCGRRSRCVVSRDGGGSKEGGLMLPVFRDWRCRRKRKKKRLCLDSGPLEDGGSWESAFGGGGVA